MVQRDTKKTDLMYLTSFFIFFIFICLIVSGKKFLVTNKRKPNTNYLKLYGNVIGRTPLEGQASSIV